MLAKLLKYELKASARTLLPLYIGILILSVICGVMFATQTSTLINASSERLEIFSGLLYLLLFALLVAMGVLTIVSIIQRFYKNLLGDEGFLMFTLPTSPTLLLTSKLLAAVIWIICGSIVGTLSIIFTLCIPIMSIENLSWNDFIYAFNLFWQELFSVPSIVTFILQLGLISFISIIVTVLMAYAAMMIGQLQPFSRHQIIVSFIAFFLIGWIFSTIYSLLPFNNLAYDFMTFDEFSQMVTALWIPIIESVIQAVILFLGTDWLMKRKLNL